MGPISDELGLEQGGPNSSDHYKIYNNEQLTSAQESGFGTTISGISVASVGQADDTALISDDISQLQCLLNLTLIYCKKHRVQLSASKTKLIVFSKQETDYVKYAKLLSPLHIGNTPYPSPPQQSMLLCSALSPATYCISTKGWSTIKDLWPRSLAWDCQNATEQTR